VKKENILTASATTVSFRAITEGVNLHSLPVDTLLDDAQAAAVLGVKKGTLSIWRTTGRYNLPYLKIGRLVRYRAGDLAAWLESRARLHSGQ